MDWLAGRVGTEDGPPIQPEGELDGSKSKEMKAMKTKLLSFAFINFSESGLFKGLRRKKIKKSGAIPTRLSGCGRASRRATVGGSPRSGNPRAFGRHPVEGALFHQPSQFSLRLRHAAI
jgi:hypothetical protein